jgi:hypothetical protein
MMDKSKVFTEAWRQYKTKREHGISVNFGEILSRAFRIARIPHMAYRYSL